MSKQDIFDLKHTLFAQQNLLHKLYDELEAEREASATSANEALSVIRRLQHEKASIRLEAEQYKRLSEEKIAYAEESLSIAQDIMYHKELEICALECQVQSYRYKLLSMGYMDRGVFEGEETYAEGSDSEKRKRDRSVSCVEEIVGKFSVFRRLTEENRIGVEDPCSRAIIHDVFEVPHIDRNLDSDEETASEIIIIECSKKYEVTILLNEIKEKLYLLQDEIRHWKAKKSSLLSTRDEPSFCPLTEAMLYFWL